MELTRYILSWLVAILGLLSWVPYLPQISLLVEKKRSDTLSYGLFGLALGIQMPTVTYILIKETIDWKLAVGFFSCIIPELVIIYLIYRYRKWPGGKGLGKSPERAVETKKRGGARKLSPKYANILFVFLTAVLMSFLMSLVVTLSNIGPHPDFFGHWMKAWGFSFLIGFPITSIVVPTVRKMVAKITAS